VFVYIYENASDFSLVVSSFAMSPSTVLGEVQLYRVVSAAFTHLSLLHLGMNMLSLVSLGSSLEALFGSLGFFFLTMLYLMLVGGLFLALASALAFTCCAGQWYSSVAGFSGVLFAYALDECSLSPNPMRSVFGLFSVPTRWYPWVLMVVLQVIMPGVSFLGHLSGLLVGMLHASGALNPLLPSLATLKRIEQLRWLAPLVRLPPFRLAPTSDPVLMGPVGTSVVACLAAAATAARPLTDCLAPLIRALPRVALPGRLALAPTPTTSAVMVGGVLMAPPTHTSSSSSAAAATTSAGGGGSSGSLGAAQLPAHLPLGGMRDCASAAEEGLHGRDGAGEEEVYVPLLSPSEVPSQKDLIQQQGAGGGQAPSTGTLPSFVGGLAAPSADKQRELRLKALEARLAASSSSARAPTAPPAHTPA
jgi:membrane associated rhomboid family serine protease